ncbi:MAG: hypothetical protein ABIS86_17295 [Streptosporangiaceae bacterium]
MNTSIPRPRPEDSVLRTTSLRALAVAAHLENHAEHDHDRSQSTVKSV